MKTSKLIIALGVIGATACLIACSSNKKMSNKIQVVTPFDIKKYAGQWYEIARFDFKHEKDMDKVTANYTLKDNGMVEVLNKGFDTKENKWKEATGKAKFNGPENQAALKVSFFGPFYAEYNVVKLSSDYKTALVFGESTDYIWILSRDKTIAEETKTEYLDFATKHGYDLSRLVWTVQ